MAATRVTGSDDARLNALMSSSRITVEWCFGELKTNSAYLDFARQIKVMKSPVGKTFLVAALLHNCRVCLYGSKTAVYFNCDPPSLSEYLEL